MGDAIMSRGITMQQEFDFLITNIKKELVRIRKQIKEASDKGKSADLEKLQKKERDALNEKRRLHQSRKFEKVSLAS